MSDLIISGAMIGIGATIAMDLWAVLINRIFGVALPDWGLVGRWFWHLGRGRIFHDDIAAATAFGQELRLGWAAHYAVGILYGIAFILIVGSAWLDSPGFVSAWMFAIATVAAGWFLLQPGMGLGIAAAATDHPWRVRAHNLAAHTAFALGLWATALILS